MTRTLLCLLSFWAFTTIFAQELIRNGSFSDGAPNYGEIPPEWTLVPADKDSWGYVNDDGIMADENGANAVFYRGGKSDSNLEQIVKCQPETTYTLSLALKPDGCLPKIEIVGQNDKVIRSIVAGGERHGMWSFEQTNFNSDKNSQLTVRLIGNVTGATGKAGFDIISILPAEVAQQLAALKTGRPEAVSSGENIALHKPYTMQPKPTYALCTDPDDKIQLTDGIYSDGYFWTQKSTVGWTRGMPIIVTVDLGREEPISGVSWNTAAGAASVSWPAGLHVFVSSDEKNWFYQGDLTVLGTVHDMPPKDKYSVFKYATGKLQAKGRWVQFLINQGPFVFCDEIEIYRGKDEWLKQENSGNSITATVDFLEEIQVDSGVRRRLQADLYEMRQNIEDLPANASGKKEALAKVAELYKLLPDLPQVNQETFSAIIPLNEIHEKILGLNAVCLQHAGFAQPFLWRNNRWENLSLTMIPPSYDGLSPLMVEMMRNEVRGETINITNPTDKTLDYLVTADGLPTGSGLQLREVLVTDTRQNQLIAAALRPSDSSDGSLQLRVPAGCTRQIWLSFYRPSLSDGLYSGHLLLQSPGQKKLSIPLSLRMAGLFPTELSLHVGGWDYLNGAATYYRAPGNLSDTLGLLQDLYVDTPWATRAVIPAGAEFDKEGRLLNADQLDFTNWDEWVERWSGARQYCIYLSVGGGKFHKEPMGTDRFNRMVSDYITAWAKHLTENKLQPQQLLLLLVDEPTRNEQDRVIIAWSKAIKAANTGMRIFEDPMYNNPNKGLPEMFALCDVLCPKNMLMLNKESVYRKFYMQQQAEGREIWLYSCSGPAKLLDPISYYRSQMWNAFDIGAKGSMFWALGCAGGTGDSWNPYSQTGVEYSPYFVSQTTVMAGKHSEALREGAQDYEYLMMLKKKVEEKKRAGKTGPKLAEAEKLLMEAPAKALAEIQPNTVHWRHAKDRSLMDQMRIEILNALQELQ